MPRREAVSYTHLDVYKRQGQKEGEGPLGSCFDQVETDPMFGQTSWEAAESELQRRTALLNIEKSGISKEKIRYLFGGDLLGQIVATSFGTAELGIPLFGLYGACSTMGEALELAAMTVAGGFADCTMAMASSHFASAERPVSYTHLDVYKRQGYGAHVHLRSVWGALWHGILIYGSFYGSGDCGVGAGAGNFCHHEKDSWQVNLWREQRDRIEPYISLLWHTRGIKRPETLW